VNYIEGNQHGKKKNARNKRRFSKATKNFKTHATQAIQKMRKTCYNYGNKWHYKHKCR